MTWLRMLCLVPLAMMATLKVALGDFDDASTELMFMILIMIWQHVADIDREIRATPRP